MPESGCRVSDCWPRRGGSITCTAELACSARSRHRVIAAAAAGGAAGGGERRGSAPSVPSCSHATVRARARRHGRAGGPTHRTGGGTPVATTPRWHVLAQARGDAAAPDATPIGADYIRHEQPLARRRRQAIHVTGASHAAPAPATLPAHPQWVPSTATGHVGDRSGGCAWGLFSRGSLATPPPGASAGGDTSADSAQPHPSGPQGELPAVSAAESPGVRPAVAACVHGRLRGACGRPPCMLLPWLSPRPVRRVRPRSMGPAARGCGNQGMAAMATADQRHRLRNSRSLTPVARTSPSGAAPATTGPAAHQPQLQASDPRWRHSANAVVAPPPVPQRQATAVMHPAAAATMSPGRVGDADAGVCTLCFSVDADAVLLECGHGGFCYSCCCRLSAMAAPAPARCPLCRSWVTFVVRIPPAASHTCALIETVPA
jgi:hypothetical protein